VVVIFSHFRFNRHSITSIIFYNVFINDSSSFMLMNIHGYLLNI
jgi:hypothetical protein